MAVKNIKVAIIGSGPAGYTAGIYLARAGLDPVIIAGNMTGGQLVNTHEIENFPGFSKVSGFDLMDKMKEHAESMGVEMNDDFIDEVDFSSYPLILKGESKDEYHAEAVIIATGTKVRWLDIESEKKYKARGVSACATCDGPFYRNKEVAVIGGGSKALEEALYLSNICAKVHLVHRRDEFRAEKVIQNMIKENEKIVIHYDSVVDEFLGDDKKLNAISLRNVKTNEIENIAVTGAFVAIGSVPNSEVFKPFVNTDENGFIMTEGKSSITNVKGVFSAGDVQDPLYCQAIVAAGSGCSAALDIQEFFLKKS